MLITLRLLFIHSLSNILKINSTKFISFSLSTFIFILSFIILSLEFVIKRFLRHLIQLLILVVFRPFIQGLQRGLCTYFILVKCVSMPVDIFRHLLSSTHFSSDSSVDRFDKRKHI